MTRTLLVVIHVVAGISGLVLGLPAFRLRTGKPGFLRLAYAAALVVLLASLIALLAMDWRDLENAVRAVFAALTILAVIIVYRFYRALAEAKSPSRGWQIRYIQHVFFTYISLWIGFLVLPALQLPYPQFSVPAVVVGTLLLGSTAVSKYKRNVLKGI